MSSLASKVMAISFMVSGRTMIPFLGMIWTNCSWASIFKASRMGVRLASISSINIISLKMSFGLYSQWMIFDFMVS